MKEVEKVPPLLNVEEVATAPNNLKLSDRQAETAVREKNEDYRTPIRQKEPTLQV